MPIIAVFLLAMVQVAVVVRDQVAVIHAAREGARAAAVSSAPAGAAGSTARAATPLEPLNVSLSSSGGRVAVTVRYTSRTDVPIVGAFIPDVELTGRATMKVEPS